MFPNRYVRATGLLLLTLAASPLFAQVSPPSPYNAGIWLNTIQEWDAKAPIQDSTDLVHRPVRDVSRTTKYVDGLGRPVQAVNWQLSPSAKDLVISHVYDSIGREARKYLPFVSNSAQAGDVPDDGNFKNDPFQQQAAFSQTRYPGETWYYGQTNYEPSPLNRVATSYDPGNSWIGAGRGEANQYITNLLTDSVHIWSIGATGTLPADAGIYPVGRLFKNVYTDVQNHQVADYTDLDGRLIMKKIQLSDNPGTANAGWLVTYYIYDDLDNLRFVLSPRAVELINTGSTWTITQSIADELCFRYEYDERKRTIIKKVPGIGERWMVYDARDRVVFSQDFVQRSQNQWISTQYDGLSRVVLTGLMIYNSSLANLQQIVTNQTLDTVTRMPTIPGSSPTLPPSLTLTASDETGDYQAAQMIEMDSPFSTLTNGSFTAEIINTTGPTIPTPNNSPVPSGLTVQLMTQTFYDDYSWMAAINTGLGSTMDQSHTTDGKYFITSYNSAPYNAVPITPYPTALGLMTGTMVQALDNSRTMYSVSFYDDHERVIQARRINYTGGIDTITVQYNFSGAQLRSLLSHHKSGNTDQGHTVLTKNNYDANLRPTSTWKNIDGAAADQLIDSMTYDELGELAVKYLGNNLDSQVFEYNIRGWVTGINKNYVGGTASHYFGMEMSYDKTASASGAHYTSALYNGNISGATWKSAGDGVDRKYDFTYDNINRLTNAVYLDNHSGSWDHSAMDYSMSNLRYDANGNIQSLSQKGFKVGHPTATIDSLNYSYQANTNRLLQVRDAVNDSLSQLGDFHYKGSKQPVDYAYDGNGKLVADNNKRIDLITYNYLNLPEKVHMNGKGNVLYTYDAAGTRVKKTVIDSTTGLATITLYQGGFEYQRRVPISALTTGADTLQFINHEEGRTRWAFQKFQNVDSAYNLLYDFFEKDHQGNTRVILTQQKDTALYAATMETTSRAKEMALFANIDSTAYPVDSIPGTYPADNTTNPNDYVARVNGSGHKMGPALLLKVMTGDSVTIGVRSFYHSNGSPGDINSSFNDVLNSLAQGLVTLTGVTHGTVADLAGSSAAPLYGALNNFLPVNDGGTAGKPKAYLNWILVDNQFNYVSGGGQSGAQQVGDAEVLKTLGQNIKLQHSGYLYIWLSNETENWDVFFDNLAVQTFAGPMLEENHFYPFGLTMAGISDKAIKTKYPENKFKYNNGSELQNKEFADGSGLELYSTDFRSYDPQIGRFHQTDPLANANLNWSPYAFAQNNPFFYNDPAGLDTTTTKAPKPNPDDGDIWQPEGGSRANIYEASTGSWVDIQSLASATVTPANNTPASDNAGKQSTAGVTTTPGTPGTNGNGNGDAAGGGKKPGPLQQQVVLPRNKWNTQAPNWTNCFGTCEVMIGKDAPKSAMIRTVVEINKHTALHTLPAAGLGVRTINGYLEAGKPIIVGVDHQLNYGVNEGTTDHFVVIVGAGSDNGNTYYRFYDPATTRIDAGASPFNRLYLQRDSSLKGTTEYKPGRVYTVTQVRPTQ